MAFAGTNLSRVTPPQLLARSAYKPIGTNATANRRAKKPTTMDASASALLVGFGIIVLGKNGSLGRFKRPAPFNGK